MHRMSAGRAWRSVGSDWGRSRWLTITAIPGGSICTNSETYFDAQRARYRLTSAPGCPHEKVAAVHPTPYSRVRRVR
jgi:hypothetical protein